MSGISRVTRTCPCGTVHHSEAIELCEKCFEEWKKTSPEWAEWVRVRGW